MSDEIHDGLHEIKKPQVENGDLEAQKTEEEKAIEKSINDKLLLDAEKTIDNLGNILRSGFSKLKQKE